MKVRLVGVFLLLALLWSAVIIMVMGQEPRPNGAAEDEQLQETGAILHTVEEYFDAKLQVRLGQAAATTLECFFDQTNTRALKPCAEKQRKPKVSLREQSKWDHLCKVEASRSRS